MLRSKKEEWGDRLFHYRLDWGRQINRRVALRLWNLMRNQRNFYTRVLSSEGGGGRGGSKGGNACFSALTFSRFILRKLRIRVK